MGIYIIGMILQSLEVLNPHYISTVDSGNLLAYLMTLKVTKGMFE